MDEEHWLLLGQCRGLDEQADEVSEVSLSVEHSVDYL